MSETGRPSEYKPEYVETARKLCLLGATSKQIAEFIGVCEQTLYNWMHKNPEFMEAIKTGKMQADIAVASSLYHRAIGYSHPETKIATVDGKITDAQEFEKHYAPDTTAAIFWLKNRQPELWRDRVEQKIVLTDDFGTVLDSDDDDAAACCLVITPSC